MKLHQGLSYIFLFFIGSLFIVKAQSFSVLSDRIEFICPDTHELITITEDLESVKSIHLSRVDNYFAIHFPEKDSVTGQTLDYFLSSTLLKFQMSGSVLRRSCAWLDSMMETTL